MSGEIVNRVEKSGLMTIDLDEIKLPKNIFEVDIKKWLFEGLFLKEKDFRTWVKSHDWNTYSGKSVNVTCSADAIIPTWSFMLTSSELLKRGIESHVLSEEEVYKLLIIEKIKNYPIEKLINGKIIIKGCSEIKYPSFALSELVKKIQPKVDSIMFGEPCSTVPIYKRRIKK